jgi:WD40 repeat protein
MERSPDGQLLASATGGSTVILWDVKTGAICGSLEGHGNPTWALAFSLDGQLLAAKTFQKTVLLWDCSEMKLLGVFDESGTTSWLELTCNGSFVIMEQGHLPLHLSPSVKFVSNEHLTCSPVIKEQWLTCNTKYVLWLPLDCRPRTVATYDNTIAMGLKSGGVVFLAFSFEKGPT